MNKIVTKLKNTVFTEEYLPLNLLTVLSMLLWFFISLISANAVSILFYENVLHETYERTVSFTVISGTVSGIIAVSASIMAAAVFIKTSKSITQATRITGFFDAFLVIILTTELISETKGWVNRDRHMITAYAYILLFGVLIFILYYRSAAHARNQAKMEDEYLFTSLYSQILAANKLEENIRNLENIFPSLNEYINEHNLNEDPDTVKYCNELREIPMPKFHKRYTSSEILNYSLVKYLKREKLIFDLSCEIQISEREGFVIGNLIDCIHEISKETDALTKSVIISGDKTAHKYEFSFNGDFKRLYKTLKHNQTIKILCNRSGLSLSRNRESESIVFTYNMKDTED